MKPELLLSVDSKQSFWIDPRTKLYMLVPLEQECQIH